jgi:hypothetical protein
MSIVKKPGLDPADVRSYRQIPNLSVASKLFDRLVARQINDHIQSNDFLLDQQSAYRPNFSTETTILQVFSDVLQAADEGDVAILALLDSSAAFDTVDHSILQWRLQITFSSYSTALQWFHSYLCG